MGDTRHRNTDWQIQSDGSSALTYAGAQLAVLMDIREELQAMRRRLDCYETLSIPRSLRAIARNTSRARCRACPKTFESRRGLDQHVRRAHAEAAR